MISIANAQSTNLSWIFIVKKLMLAIEIDGSSHDSEEAQARDRERQARLESLGVRFLRFREEEVCREVEGVLKAIEDWILTHQIVTRKDN